jgi:hypothetical protein
MSIQEENKRLRTHLWELVKAQGRMLERWADGDGMVQKETWQELHSIGNAAREYLESIGSKVNAY